MRQLAAAGLLTLLAAGVVDAAGLRLQVPQGWKEQTASRPNGPSQISLVAPDAGGKTLTAKITVVPLKGRKLTDDQLRKLAETTGQQYVASSVEGKIDPVPLTGEHVHGYTFTLTDAHPKPGDAACVSPVIATVDDAMLIVTILHPTDSIALPTALAMLKEARVGDAAAAATKPAAEPNRLRLLAPGGKWAVVVDIPGVRPAEPNTAAGGKSVQLMTAAADGVIVSAFIEPAAQPGDARTARIVYWSREKKAPMDFSKVKMTGDKDLALLSYSIDGTDRNAHAYLMHDKQWVDVHLSRPNGTDADAAALDAILKTARVEPVTP